MSRSKEKSCPALKTSIGGQALIEGIMMRGPKRSAMAVRNMQDEIVIEEWDTPGNSRPGFFKIPVVRGIFNFFDSLKTGYKALTRSAEISTLEAITKSEEPVREAQAENGEPADEPASESAEASEAQAASEPVPDEAGTESEPEKAEASATGTDDPEDSKERKKKDRNARTKIEVKEEEKLSKAQISLVMVLGIVLGLALAVGLFILAPTYSATGILYLTGVDGTTPTGQIWRSVIEGLIKIVLLVGYVAAVALMKDIRRTYMYHGAEHKTIFCYEAGLPLTVENVRGMRRFHPRCGTSFMILMVLVSIFVGFFIPSVYVADGPTWLNTLIRAAIKLALVPLTVGIGYELLKFAGRHDNVLTKIISAPGIALQHLTVYEPDDDMIEVAIAAVQKVIPDDGSDRIR